VHRKGSNEQLLSSIMTDVELAILHEVPSRNAQFNRICNPMLHYNSDECAKVARKQITFTKPLGSGTFGKVKINFFMQCFKLISGSHTQQDKYVFSIKYINYMNIYNRL